MYHSSTEDLRDWSGPTGFYRNDVRAPLAPDLGATWSPIHVWADPSYTEDYMSLVFEPYSTAPPPTNRTYELELLYAPPGLAFAPPVGTRWQVPATETFSLKLQTYAAADGLAGYQFALHASPVPEPASGVLGVAATLCAGAYRRQRRAAH